MSNIFGETLSDKDKIYNHEKVLSPEIDGENIYFLFIKLFFECIHVLGWFSLLFDSNTGVIFKGGRVHGL